MATPKHPKKSKVYVLVFHTAQNDDIEIRVTSENYEDLQQYVSDKELYVSTYPNLIFDFTKEYIDKKIEDYLSGDWEGWNLASVVEAVIPENREMYLVVGTGDYWNWEASVLGLYPNLNSAWRALVKFMKGLKDYKYNYVFDKKHSLYNKEEYYAFKSIFLQNIFNDNNLIEWFWFKVKINNNPQNHNSLPNPAEEESQNISATCSPSSFTNSNLTSIILDQEETYNPLTQKIWCFKHVDDIVEGTLLNLGNMVSCYPFQVDRIDWRSSEELYLAGEFSLDSEEHRIVQEALRAAKSPYAAKRFVKGKHHKLIREDFPEFRTQWMLWCVWQKCKGNEDFRKKLLSIPDDVILIEETTTDTGGTAKIWGCSNKELSTARKQLKEKLTEENGHLTKKALAHLINVETNAIRNIGLFTGQNNIGKILMICKQCLRDGTEPDINFDLLRSKHIHLLGKELQF